MADDTLRASSVFLSVLCALFLILSFVFNFTFLITLLKLRRLNNTDKSNFFLTHLILIDFICAFFVIIPSGYGVYNTDKLASDGCHLQLYFITFYFSSTFYGLFALSVERFFKYKYPVSHINVFTARVKNTEDGTTEHVVRKKYMAHLIIFILWILNILIAFIPMFGNFANVQYFVIQSQCDYQYENFPWWLWFYFWVSLTIPFIGSLIFYILALRLIILNARIINARQNKIKTKSNEKETQVNTGKYILDLIFSCVTRRKKVAQQTVKANQTKIRRGYSDTTKLPENTIFYSHIINIQNLEDDQYSNASNDMHVRKQLLIQFKYDTERSKTMTFLIVTIVSYCLVFPLYVIHFYRTYYNIDPKNDNFDDPNVVSFPTYTAFVWISYFTFIIKSTLCLLHNKFYRYSLYQAANCRGFHGIFEYQIARLKKNLKELEDDLGLGDDDNKKNPKNNDSQA